MEIPSIELIFGKGSKVENFKLSFQDSIQEIKESSFKCNLPESIFKYRKDNSLISIKLFFKDPNETKEIKWNVYYGENHIYIKRDILGISCELIFKDFEKLEITSKDMKYNKLDTFETKNRKRLVLINCEESITINNTEFNISNIISSNCDVKADSYQISVFSLENEIFGVKPILDGPPILNLNELKNKKDEILNAAQKFELKLLNIKGDYDYINQMAEFKKNLDEKLPKTFINSVLNMNLPELYLEESFKENGWIDLNFYFNVIVLDYIYKFHIRVLLNRAIIKEYINKAKEILNNLNNNGKLKIYQKIQILKDCLISFNNTDNIQDLNKLNFRFYFMSECEQNSILKKVQIFFDKLIDNIREESKIFNYLLYLNSGNAYHKKETIYTFGMYNEKMIKEHLKEIFPKFLIFYNNPKSKKYAFHGIGGIAINEFFLNRTFQIKNIDYDKNMSIDEKVINSITMNICLEIIHEYMGHKKYHSGFLGEFVNGNQIIKLKYYKEYNSDDKNTEFILASKGKKGDRRLFLELSFGKIENKLVFTYLKRFNDNGKLLNRYDLFSGKDSKTLEKYLNLKRIIKKNKISVEITDFMTIEEEISEMEKYENTLLYKREREKGFEEQEKEDTKKKKIESEENEENNENDEFRDDSENEEEECESNEDCENKKISSILQEFDGVFDICEENYEEIENYLTKKFNFKSDKSFVLQMTEKIDDPNTSLQDKNLMIDLIDSYNSVQY